MDSATFIKAIGALIFTLAVIIIVAYLFKNTISKLSNKNAFSSENLLIEEVKAVDMKHKLVVASYENKRYLLLMGNQVQPQIIDIIIDKEKKVNKTPVDDVV